MYVGLRWRSSGEREKRSRELRRSCVRFEGVVTVDSEYP